MLHSFITKLGSAVCHQDANRCYSIAATCDFTCARCSGIYIGFLFTWLLLRWSKVSKLSLHHKAIALLLVVFGASTFYLKSYLGVELDTNHFRFFAGHGCGIGMGILAFSLQNRSETNHNSLTPSTFFLRTLGYVGLLIIVIVNGLFIILNILALMGFLYLIFSINSLFIKEFFIKNLSVLKYVALTLLSIFIELYLIFKLKY